MSDEGFLMNLPFHIILDILSRLPAQSILTCKLVCKKWLCLISTPEFANLHLFRSTPGLVVFIHESGGAEFCRLFEFNDNALDHHDLHYDPEIKFELSASLGISSGATVQVGSINGLVCLRNFYRKYDALYVCNPITREYVALPVLDWLFEFPSEVTYGFGLSIISGQYKVVRIFHECVLDPTTGTILSIPKYECHVYTLGTGSWRSIEGVLFAYNCRSVGLFFNGNLHWVIEDLEGSELISCFDVEKESFQPFPFPFPGERHKRALHSLGVVADCLCLCDNTSDSEIVIWVMKEYGVKKSWIKEFVISKMPDFAGTSYEMVHALKVFENGDILMSWDDYYLFFYRNQSKTLQQVEVVPNNSIQTMLHVPSLFSLKNFTENVRVF
ncbi:F-box protein CPR30-like [Olea europaea var. sylvestris]|uniref:F-box protein CPR30-like n=1 Tax=Olea europaea var. sylvestris TaxID=158386 RepID=UPI000C1D7FF5|nr:F-box protein CPR30-like [Olea europaea var. sylvestris]